MPKRPCSISLTSDERTILCADKFGDVYSLPLFGISYESLAKEPLQEKPDAPKPYVPAATSKTVHTRKNREALRNQQNPNLQKAEKRVVHFDHQLLLGHVSLLTNVACATITDKASPSARSRTYILTADRDEHIRVSRGIPQAHIIEQYCLGHTEFVSKLCIPSWNSQLLVSGGGDDFILVWDWVTGTIRQKVDIKCHVDALRIQYAVTMEQFRDTEKALLDEGDKNVAVSGIWALKTSAESCEPQGVLLVTCEGYVFYSHRAQRLHIYVPSRLPAILTFSIDLKANLNFLAFEMLPGNIIDVTPLVNEPSIVYSMDNVHEAFSTRTVASDQKQESRPLLGAFKPPAPKHPESATELYSDAERADEGGEISRRTFPEQANPPYPYLGNALAVMNQHAKTQEPTTNPAKDNSLTDLLYNLENLRKRNQED